MPVTKKKGAIFAIYADSPTHPSASTSTSAITSTHPLTSHSPTKRLLPTSRKALVPLQPRGTRAFPTSTGLKPSEKEKEGDPKGKATTPKTKTTTSSVNPKPSQPHISSGLRRVHPPPPPRTAPSKRQLEIFSSPTFPSPPALGVVHTTPSSLTRRQRQTAPSPRNTGPAPAKRGRLTPAKPKVDKENQTPPSSADSPAGRTRSKVRIDTLVGDGWGTLTLRKGRMLASLVGEMGDGERDGSGKGRTRRLGEVAVLVDVSEAYGASGVEPEGFRDIPR